MIRTLLMTLLLLSGCASQAPLPAGLPDVHWPQQLHVQRQAADSDAGAPLQDWLLIVQQEDAGLRWSMMDPLGIPQARQRLSAGQWQADGFLPPNPEARELFAALLFALTPQAQLAARYPAAYQQGLQRKLESRWLIDYQSAEVFTLTVQSGLRYHITPLNRAKP